MPVITITVDTDYPQVFEEPIQLYSAAGFYIGRVATEDNAVDRAYQGRIG